MGFPCAVRRFFFLIFPFLFLFSSLFFTGKRIPWRRVSAQTTCHTLPFACWLFPCIWLTTSFFCVRFRIWDSFVFPPLDFSSGETTKAAEEKRNVVREKLVGIQCEKNGLPAALDRGHQSTGPYPASAGQTERSDAFIRWICCWTLVDSGLPWYNRASLPLSLRWAATLACWEGLWVFICTYSLY